MITRTFSTHYMTEHGILMIFGDDYFCLVRVDTGLCQRFTYEQFGF